MAEPQLRCWCFNSYSRALSATGALAQPGPAAPDYATWRTVKHSVLPGQLAAPLAALTASPPKKNVVLLRRKKKLINIVKERSASAPIKYVPIGVK